MTLSSEQITRFLRQYRPDFEPVDVPEELHGGNLNNVLRVKGKNESLIVKHAPPHIATNPGIPLNPNRLEFEAKALQLFQNGGELTNLASDEIRPPDIYGFDNSQFLLLMEDIAHARPWFECIKKQTNPADSARRLGTFIGKLHSHTSRNNNLAALFSNRPVQQTRLNVQYQSVEESLLKAGFHDVGRASTNAVELGLQLLKPGKCLIMGDLWPPSVLVQNGNLRLIDWEFSHYGRPLQDLAHFGAHCFMHSLFTDKDENLYQDVWLSFLDGYKAGAKNASTTLLDEDERKWLPVHFGAEILVRTAGPFQDGYLFSDLPDHDPVLQRALRKSFTMLNYEKSLLWPEELF